VVVNRQILTQLVQIRTDAGALLTIAAEDINERNVPAPEPAGDETAGRREAPAQPPPGPDAREPESPSQPRRRPKKRTGANGRTQTPPGAVPQPGPPQAGPAGPRRGTSGPSSVDEGRTGNKDAEVQPPRRRRGRRPRRHRRPGEGA
jgi:hypothetical protein